MEINDSKLVADYLEGDEKALESLVDKYLSDVFRFALQLVKDESLAEDIAQESFVKAWNKLRTFDQDRDFRSWLFTVVRNTAMDHLRKKRIEFNFSSFEDALGENNILNKVKDEQPLPDELLILAEDTEYVHKVLTELDSKYTDVLDLRYRENFTFEKIGKILKRPLHTVKSQHRRALAMLRRVLKTQTD